MIQRKIGERFMLNGKTLEVRKCGLWYSCKGCAFNDGHRPSRDCYQSDLLDETGECNGLVRKDGTYVYFAEI